MTEDEAAMVERAVKLRKMTAEYLRDMTPQQRDRMLQTHLAQARGPMGNIVLLRQMTAFIFRARKMQEQREQNDDK